MYNSTYGKKNLFFSSFLTFTLAFFFIWTNSNMCYEFTINIGKVHVSHVFELFHAVIHTMTYLNLKI